MTGIVVVSHSEPLALAAVDLALQMAQGKAPRVEVAAGVDDGAGGKSLGTDAAAIQGAIEAADDGQGVLVLMDLGSAIMSAQTAVEFLDPDLAARTRLSPAPLVEGLVGAVVAAAGGDGLDAVAAEAESAGPAKQMQVGG